MLWESRAENNRGDIGEGFSEEETFKEALENE